MCPVLTIDMEYGLGWACSLYVFYYIYKTVQILILVFQEPMNNPYWVKTYDQIVLYHYIVYLNECENGTLGELECNFCRISYVL